ncbi:MAG: hypothetical protein WD035_10990 [Balneolaceae bacterium]
MRNLFHSSRLVIIQSTVLGVCLLAFSSVFILSGCTPSDDRSDGASDRQTAFRIRSDFTTGLNDDRGWAGALNENVTVNVEEPFRIRFELESAADSMRERRFYLQYRRNNGEWADVDAQKFPYPLRELELNFENDEVGEMPGGWHLVQGNASDIEVAAGEQQPFLRVRTDQEPLLGLGRYEILWEPVEFAAKVRLPEGVQSGAGIIFGYVDPENYCSVYLDAGGAVRASRFVDGEETAITEESTSVASGRWLEVQITLDGDEVEVEFDDDALTFTASLGAAIPSSAIGFYVPANSTAEFQEFIVEGEAGTPRVSIIDSQAYENGEQTRDLLAGSNSTFMGGAGVNSTDRTISWPKGNGQSEWEWPLAIRRFADGAVSNNEGDTFEFRMAYEDGSPVVSGATPVVTAAVPPGLLGGTFVETPGRIGPWEASNGDFYFLMEPAETYNVLMAVKSTDGGKTWQEVGGENRPVTDDLEGFASDLQGNTIHILHQISESVWYHSFRTSDHPTDPDTWDVRDELVARHGEPPTQVASIAVRSDGSIVGVYGGPEKIRFKIRSPDGLWGNETVIDAEAPPNLSGPQVVLGEDDVVHLAYTGNDGTAWYRRIQPNGTLTPRVQLAAGLGTTESDVGSILPLVFISETNTVVVIYRLASGRLWERRIINHGSPTDPVQISDRVVVQNAADSDQTGADAIAYGTSVHVLFIEEDSGSIYHTYRNEADAWQPSTLIVDGVQAQWIRGAPLIYGNEKHVYGFVYDAGSNGGSGMNKFEGVPLDGN